MTTSAAGTVSIRAMVSLRKHLYSSVASSGARKGSSLVFTFPGCGALAATASTRRIGLGFAPSIDLIQLYGLFTHFVQLHLDRDVPDVELVAQLVCQGVEQIPRRCASIRGNVSGKRILAGAYGPNVQIVNFLDSRD